MRNLVALIIAVDLLAPPVVARAEQDPPAPELPGWERVVPDLSPRPLVPLFFDTPANASVSAAFAAKRADAGSDFSASLVVTIPTSGFGSGRKAKGLGGVAKPAEGAPASAEPLAQAPRDTQQDVEPAPTPAEVLPPIRPRDAREAIGAAWRAHGRPAASARLDGLASRARWSALLPELRLRATRLTDESNSLSPTSYDPDRTTSRGGASLWLEARSTWALDRLLFASEEVRLEGLRQGLDDERARAARRVLDLLLAWQRAAYAVRAPQTAPDVCEAEWLREQQLALELDVETGGWFGRWAVAHGEDAVECPPLPPRPRQQPPSLAGSSPDGSSRKDAVSQGR